MENRDYKRQYRELDDATKARISASLRHRGKSETHKQNISTGMLDYWKTVPSRKAEESENNTTSNPQTDGIM